MNRILYSGISRSCFRTIHYRSVFWSRFLSELTWSCLNRLMTKCPCSHIRWRQWSINHIHQGSRWLRRFWQGVLRDSSNVPSRWCFKIWCGSILISHDITIGPNCPQDEFPRHDPQGRQRGRWNDANTDPKGSCCKLAYSRTSLQQYETIMWYSILCIIWQSRIQVGTGRIPTCSSLRGSSRTGRVMHLCRLAQVGIVTPIRQ